MRGQVKFQSFVKLCVKFLITDLLEDVRVSGLIDLEGFSAVRAGYFVHIFGCLINSISHQLTLFICEFIEVENEFVYFRL